MLHALPALAIAVQLHGLGPQVATETAVGSGIVVTLIGRFGDPPKSIHEYWVSRAGVPETASRLRIEGPPSSVRTITIHDDNTFSVVGTIGAGTSVFTIVDIALRRSVLEREVAGVTPSPDGAYYRLVGVGGEPTMLCEIRARRLFVARRPVEAVVEVLSSGTTGQRRSVLRRIEASGELMAWDELPDLLLAELRRLIALDRRRAAVSAEGLRSGSEERDYLGELITLLSHLAPTEASGDIVWADHRAVAGALSLAGPAALTQIANALAVPQPLGYSRYHRADLIEAVGSIAGRSARAFTAGERETARLVLLTALNKPTNANELLAAIAAVEELDDDELRTVVGEIAGSVRAILDRGVTEGSEVRQVQTMASRVAAPPVRIR